MRKIIAQGLAIERFGLYGQANDKVKSGQAKTPLTKPLTQNALYTVTVNGPLEQFLANDQTKSGIG